jgi:hypothetical protein
MTFREYKDQLHNNAIELLKEFVIEHGGFIALNNVLQTGLADYTGIHLYQPLTLFIQDAELKLEYCDSAKPFGASTTENAADLPFDMIDSLMVALSLQDSKLIEPII